MHLNKAHCASINHYWLMSLILPVHAQTSTFDALCMDCTSTWLTSDCQENGTQLNQGSPEAKVEFTISGNQIDLVADCYGINSDTNFESRARAIENYSVSLLNREEASSASVGNPVASPNHAGVRNLANNLAQTCTLDSPAAF